MKYSLPLTPQNTTHNYRELAQAGTLDNAFEELCHRLCTEKWIALERFQIGGEGDIRLFGLGKNKQINWQKDKRGEGRGSTNF